MAEPLAVVPALNTMIPLCALLAFWANVSRSPWVVQAVSRTVLLVLITLAWLSQPASKIQDLVSQLWGCDTMSTLSALLEEVKNNKILRVLKNEMLLEEPRELFHEYIEELTDKEKKNLITFMDKDQVELGKIHIRKISLSATLYQDISKIFPTDMIFFYQNIELVLIDIDLVLKIKIFRGKRH